MYKLLCFVLLLSSANCAKILGVFMTPSYSHQIVFQPIWRELSLRGHQVTVLTPNPLKDPSLTNLTEIDLGSSYHFSDATGTMGSNEHSATAEFEKLVQVYMQITEEQLSHPEVKRLIEEEDQYFDLLLVEFLWPSMYAFKDRFNCPMIGITSLGLITGNQDAIGLPKHPGLDPDSVLPFSTNLSLKERAISTAYSILYRINRWFKLTPKIDAQLKQFFNLERSVSDIAKDVSLVIVNSNLVHHNAKPTIPAYVDISGIHIKPPKTLPEDLQYFLDNSKKGVIYFSLGSNVKSNMLPKEKLDDLLSVFAKLPYKILWKFESNNFTNLPSNVEIRQWLPQQDVLRHPNVKLFITQGGLQSLDEAVHSKVPMLAVPFFGDQRHNAHRIAHLGAGLNLNFHTFTREELEGKIVDLITNPKYKKTMAKLHAIASDQPMPALEKAVWWIEYVIRHDGAEHLKYPGVHTPFYEYFLLDVMLVFAAALFLISYVLLHIFRRIVIGYKVCVRIFKYLRSSNIYPKSKKHLD